jgi:hypothetical protein
MIQFCRCGWYIIVAKVTNGTVELTLHWWLRLEQKKLGHCHSDQNLLKMAVFQLVMMLTSISLSIICSLSSYRFEQLYLYVSRLCGVVVSVFATGPEDWGFEPGQGNGFLRAIKIRSTLSFRWEVKPEVPWRKILRHVKDFLKFHGEG